MGGGHRGCNVDDDHGGDGSSSDGGSDCGDGVGHGGCNGGSDNGDCSGDGYGDDDDYCGGNGDGVGSVMVLVVSWWCW